MFDPLAEDQMTEGLHKLGWVEYTIIAIIAVEVVYIVSTLGSAILA